MDIANYNMGQYHISWCVRGDNTPEYADYLGYLDFWKLYPCFPRGRSLKTFYKQILGENLPRQTMVHLDEDGGPLKATQ